MKSNNFFYLTLIFFVFNFISCQSTKSTQSNTGDIVSKIKLEKVTIGSNSVLEITKNEILHSETQRDGSGDAVKGEMSQKNWKEINSLVSKLDLSQIDQWEGPTQARFYDGAKATVIIIEFDNGEVYNSQSFDEGEPPVELKELYGYLESLVNQ